MAMICTVNVAPGIRYELEAEDDLRLKAGDEVLVQLERCQDTGMVVAVKSSSQPRENDRTSNHQPDPDPGSESAGDTDSADNRKRRHKGTRSRVNGSHAGKTGRILRRLNLKDKARVHEKRTREVSMLRTAIRKVKEHNLKMKMLNCHYTYDCSMVFFQFVADGRVDFRNLVKDLSGALHARVELRQVGVRDEASLVGGIGCCGRPFCCATILNKFPAVNVKTAKEQRLSLNPSSVSGSCGRLKCCLRYELEGYREMNKSLPRINSRCQTREGNGKVVDCNALTRCARVRLDGDTGRCVDLPVEDLIMDK